jgi:preprotein translocase subunit SecF
MKKKLHTKVMSISEKFVNFYKKNYKKLLIFPALIFLISVGFIAHTTFKEGVPIYRDISLKGGLSAIINVETPISSEELKIDLESEYTTNSFAISELFEDGQKIGFIIDTDLDEDTLKSNIESKFETSFEFGDNYNSNFISPTLSSAFFKQAIYILLISFVLMSTVIFLYFRQLVPSGAVVLSAIFDIIVTVGILDAMSFKISIAGIGALIMIIGYSIDTDVLLTNRTYKEKGTNYFEKTGYAFKTGSLMSFTTFITGIAAMILTNSTVIFEIALILVIGLLVDFISTWFQNAGILIWWLNNKNSNPGNK